MDSGSMVLQLREASDIINQIMSFLQKREKVDPQFQKMTCGVSIKHTTI